LHFVSTLLTVAVRNDRPSEVAVEQMHVGRERERCGVMPEPVLNLDGVAAGREHARGDRVAERVKPRPGDSRLLAGRREHRHRQVEFDDPTEASEVILLADLLLRMLDRIENRLELT
jgi:hypothetical protein